MRAILSISFALFIYIFSTPVINAAEPLAAYQLNGEWHFIDSDGKEMFPAMRIIDVLGYSEGMILIKEKIEGNAHHAFINLKGEQVSQPDCDNASTFSNGMALIAKHTDTAKVNGKYGFINKSGKLAIPMIYDDAINFSENLAYVKSKDKRGYIDTGGNFVFELENVVGYPFCNGIAAISTPKYLVGYINKSGKIIINPTFEDLFFFSEGLAKQGTNRYGYIDTTGNFVIKPQFGECNDFHEGMAFVAIIDQKHNCTWGLIDKTGQKIINYKFTNVFDFSEGVAAVQFNKMFGYIDKTGNYVIPSQFDTADSFKNGLAWAIIKKDNKYGFINKKGEFIITIPKPEKIIDLRLNHKLN
jgi:hypothetical protein